MLLKAAVQITMLIGCQVSAWRRGEDLGPAKSRCPNLLDQAFNETRVEFL